MQRCFHDADAERFRAISHDISWPGLQSNYSCKIREYDVHAVVVAFCGAAGARDDRTATELLTNLPTFATRLLEGVPCSFDSVQKRFEVS